MPVGPQLIVKAEDGIRDVHGSRGLGDVYKRQSPYHLIVINPKFKKVSPGDCIKA